MLYFLSEYLGEDDSLFNSVTFTDIHTEITGSDHCPVELGIEKI